MRIPIRGARKTAADKLSRSRREIPEATVWVDVDATELVALRTALNADESVPRISLLAMVSRYAILGLHRYPELNGRIEGDEIVVGGPVHLGFAAQTGRGLVVPVGPTPTCARRRSCPRRSTGPSPVRESSGRRVGWRDFHPEQLWRVRRGRLGSDHQLPRSSDAWRRPHHRQALGCGGLAVRKVTELTLAFDHRVCDGGTADGFLRFVADCGESPARALRDM